MHNPITLILKDRRGNTLDLYDIDPAAPPLTIEAIAGAYYQFNDEVTGFAPSLETRRVGDALHVSFNGDAGLVIAHYFSREQGALIGLQEGGGMQRYPVSTAPEHSLATEVAASDSANAAPLVALGAVGLLAGGAALAGKERRNEQPQADNQSPNTPSDPPEPPTPQPPIPQPPIPQPPAPQPPTPQPPTPQPPTPQPPTPQPPTPQPPTPQPPTPQPPTPQPPTPQPPTTPNKPGSISIRGSAKIGATLTADVADDDGVPANVQYQWFANDAAIPGANGKTLTLTAAQAGKAINVRASYTDLAQHQEAPQSDTLTVENPPPNPQNHAPTGAVTVSGKIQAGETILASNTLADADGMGDVNYQWYADGAPIGSGKNYTLDSADIGKNISVRASYTDGLGNLESRDSLPTAAAGKAASAPPFTNTFDEKTFKWAGVDWFARDTDWAPGAPQKSGEWSRDNIHVHGDTLDMHLTNGSGESPVAAQVSTSEAMGYGSYQLTVSGNFANFDAYTVFGFFTYEWIKPSIPGYRELDAIEISRWGGKELQGLFTYWPTDDAIKVRPSYAWPDDLGRATIRMDWSPERITWTVSDPESGKTLHQVSSTENIPAADKQQIHLNFWTYSYDAPGWHKAKPQQISVESFSYTPSDAAPKQPYRHTPPLRQLLEADELLPPAAHENVRAAAHDNPPQYSHNTMPASTLPEDEALRLAGIL